MKITVLGSGTSNGIPVVGCTCDVCASINPKNKRTRASILIEEKGQKILIDTSIEFRLQAREVSLTGLDAILYTHAHADHLHGLDDIRPFCRKGNIPVYGSRRNISEIEKRFDYIFRKTQKGGGKPKININIIEGNRQIYVYTRGRFSKKKLGIKKRLISKQLNIRKNPWRIRGLVKRKKQKFLLPICGGIDLLPINIKHGKLDILAYRIGKFAYVTDCSAIPPESMSLLTGLDCLILGALRYRPHETHFSINEAIDIVKKLSPKEAYFTHFCHDIEHDRIYQELSRVEGQKIKPAFDGLEILC